MRVPEGRYVAICDRSTATPDDTLSIIVPAYNEAGYVGAVLDALLDARFVVPHEIVVVESNSTDGTREIVRQYEGIPGVTVVLEDEPRGKGAAVRHGIAASSGSIILIQDADFEYDLDDYDALLEPIKQHRTSFVLGSRSLGIDDWKVRKMASSRVKAFLMNGAQLLFAKTFNVLYQQRVTDVNTMFKVFRRECLDGLVFTADGFSFDIELACMLIRAGYRPMEVPVNYVARGFDEGKKIHFLTEFFPSYSMFFRCCFSRSRRE
jgi:glycosyltransferase involved in cell wall biosynthesis